MPSIKPFRGIHPSPGFAEKVALQVESLSLEQAKLIRQDNPFSYINMLVPKINPLFGRGSKQELAFKMINENLDEFIEKGILVQDKLAGIYIYRVSGAGVSQTGVWTLTSIDDYLENRVKRHELTREDRERALVEYVKQTGIDANPVLITYPADAEIEKAISAVVSNEALLSFNDAEKHYELWAVHTPTLVNGLVERFAALSATYIADGHHRAAAACSYGLARRKANINHRGDEEYNFFTTVYMPADQLKIIAFHRLLKLGSPVDVDELLSWLENNFLVEPQPGVTMVIPESPKTFGMYIDSRWYLLRYLDNDLAEGPVGDLDVSILQDFVLAPYFHIGDPRTDPRLSVSGGQTPVENLVDLVNRKDYSLVFTLFPTSIRHLFSVADAGEVMPPKSTWFEPKFQAGLLIHQVD